jgi:hypothetical protein
MTLGVCGTEPLLDNFESMKVWLPLLLSALLLGGIYSCRKSSNSPIPYIELISLSPDTIKGGSPADTAFLTFHFSDGDGDLGNDISQGDYDVFLRDMRDSVYPILRFPFPNIPDEARDPIDGLRGQGAIALYGVNLIPRQDTIHKFRGDTVVYQMWIMDRAKNLSNVITTTPLYIRP